MFKIMAFLKRRDEFSSAEFRDYYENVHVPLACEVAGGAPPAYRRNHIQWNDPSNRNADQLDFDVITEIEFPDRESLNAWAEKLFAPETNGRIIDDEARFIQADVIRIVVVEQCTTSGRE